MYEKPVNIQPRVLDNLLNSRKKRKHCKYEINFHATQNDSLISQTTGKRKINIHMKFANQSDEAVPVTLSETEKINTYDSMQLYSIMSNSTSYVNKTDNERVNFKYTIGLKGLILITKIKFEQLIFG